MVTKNGNIRVVLLSMFCRDEEFEGEGIGKEIERSVYRFKSSIAVLLEARLQATGT